MKQQKNTSCYTKAGKLMPVKWRRDKGMFDDLRMYYTFTKRCPHCGDDTFVKQFRVKWNGIAFEICHECLKRVDVEKHDLSREEQRQREIQLNFARIFALISGWCDTLFAPNTYNTANLPVPDVNWDEFEENMLSVVKAAKLAKKLAEDAHRWEYGEGWESR